MRVGASPEGLFERLALTLNLAPKPLVDTQVAFNAARAIMSAAKLGIFEALGRGQKRAVEVAESCATDPRATEQLLNCLVGIGYARYARGRYAMPRRLRKWLVRGSRTSFVDKLVFQIFEWDYMQRLDEFVRTGRPIDLHAVASPEEWRAYQDGMRDSVGGPVARGRAQAGASARRDAAPRHRRLARPLLDRAVQAPPQLRATILELPGAIDRASQIAAREGLGDRVAHRSGNALTDELGDDWDVVFISNVVHHFTARGKSPARRAGPSRAPAARPLRGRRAPARERARRRRRGGGHLRSVFRAHLGLGLLVGRGDRIVDVGRGLQGAAADQVSRARLPDDPRPQVAEPISA